MEEATICFHFVKYEEVPTHIVQNILKENQDKELDEKWQNNLFCQFFM